MAGRFDATKRRPWIRANEIVDKDRASLYLRCNPAGAIKVTAPYRGTQAVLGPICQVNSLAAGRVQGHRGDLSGLPEWRTALVAALEVLQGQSVPGPSWILPQPVITKENLVQYVDPNMPPLFYAVCGCQDLPGYPERFGGKK